MGVQEDTKLLKQFDKDKSGVLNAEERKAAREFLKKEKEEGRGPRRPGPPGGGGFGGRRGEPQTPPEPGPKLAPAEVKNFPDAPLYDPAVLRTLFFEFESEDWEKELTDFYHTDVEVPAKLTVDGKVFKDVGVRFRGASSFFTVSEGRKRSLNVSLDLSDEKQVLHGYRTLNLLNSHTDPTFLRSILYFTVARDYIPAPKANYVRVVINGESWGPYVNVEQFNKDFVKAAFGSSKGARWKVPGSPRGNGGLSYLGDNPADYKKLYEIKSKDEPKSWAELIRLCRVLNQTPVEALEKEIAPLLDVEGVLKFLAIENTLINGDGYWVRSSDYNIYQDEKGRFHVIPHDSNETFRAPGGPGGGDRGGASGVELDPMAGADDASKPLLSKLLSVPKFKKQYLVYVRDIAEKWLTWEKVGPLASKHQAVISEDVRTDTHKLDPFQAFTEAVTKDREEQDGRGSRRLISLKNFVEKRREYLLNHEEIKKVAKSQ